MSDESRILAGVLFLSLVTAETGGLYLVKLWKTGAASGGAGATPFQIGFARAGHAHAGVLLVLGLLCLQYVDQAGLATGFAWVARVGVPAAAILMPAGFFAASAGAGRTKPNGYIALVFAGGAVMAAGLTTLGVGLLAA